MAALPGPLEGTKLTGDYLRSLGRLAYLWGWPLVNMHNRLSIASRLPGPGLLGGVVPLARREAGDAPRLHPSGRERWWPAPTRTWSTGSGSSMAEVAVDGPGARLRGSVLGLPGSGPADRLLRPPRRHVRHEPGLYLVAPTTWDGESQKA